MGLIFSFVAQSSGTQSSRLVVRGCASAAAIAALSVVAFQPVSADEAGVEIDSTRSIWDGVFTEAQARRGEAIYAGPCGSCHGWRLDGAADDPDMPSTPPIAGAKFLRDWDGRSLAALLEYTRATMPENNPGFLSDREYADILAYMLYISGVSSGDEELRSQSRSITDVVIRQMP